MRLDPWTYCGEFVTVHMNAHQVSFCDISAFYQMSSSLFLGISPVTLRIVYASNLTLLCLNSASIHKCCKIGALNVIVNC